jgi:hypothetical protein
MMTPDQKSRAVLLYLSVGRLPMPYRDPDALITEFGTDEGEKLEKYVQGLLSEMFSIPTQEHWQEHSLVSLTDAAKAGMRVRHPQLSDEVIQALGWAFSFYSR